MKGIRLDTLQAKLEEHAVHTVQLNYYPGGHWDCELKTIKGVHVRSEPSRHMGETTKEAVCKLDARLDSARVRKAEPCRACEGRGFLFPWRDDTGLACVEKCDACNRFKYDDEAAAELAKILLPNGYAITYMCLPGMKWEQPGAGAFVVMKHHSWDGGEDHYHPLTFEEGMRLAVELGLEKEPAVTCPECGAAELHVQLPAVFLWNGRDCCVEAPDLRSSEFPIEEDAAVICNECEWTGKVKDLAPLKGEKKGRHP